MNIMSRTSRILEDTVKPVVVETKRRKTTSPRAEAEALFIKPAKIIDHAIASVVLGDGGGNPPDGPMNAYPSEGLSFLKAGDIHISAERALFLTSHCVHPIQQSIRPLDHQSAKEHIATLVAMMKTPDAWMDETQLRFGILFGQLWAMDGNHRLRAQSIAGCTILWNVKIDHYATEAEFLQAFHKFNTNTRGRTESQILNAIGYAGRHGITKQTATAIYNAMPFIISKFRTGRVRDEDEIRLSRVVDSRLQLMSKYVSEALLFDECMKRADSRVKRKLLGAGVTAVAIVTLKARPYEAKEFWSGAAKNDGLKKGDPRHTFVMDLLTRTLNKGDQHQSIAMPAVAWNAWLAGKELSQIHILETDFVRIAGTPFQG